MKRFVSLLLAFGLSLTLMTAFTSAFASGDPVVLYTEKNTQEGWDEYERKIEEATGIEIEALAFPTNPDDRQAKATTILASGDSSVDLMYINDEQVTAFKYAGFLEPLQNDVMNPEVAQYFSPDFLKGCMVGENIYSVPVYMSCLMLFINQHFLDELGMEAPTNYDEFVEFITKASKPEEGIYGYGGAWERTYVFNEIGLFINLFGGDYFDWTNEKTQKALKFMYDMCHDLNCTPIDQMADIYDPMLQKFFDGKYGCVFMWGGSLKPFQKAGVYGDDFIHIIPMPTFETNVTYQDAMHYVLNASSDNKENAKKVLEYLVSPEGQLAYTDFTGYVPARSDVLFSDILDQEPYASRCPNVPALREYFESGTVSRPLVPRTMEHLTEIGTIFQEYVTDQITLEQAVERAQAAHAEMVP